MKKLITSCISMLFLASVFAEENAETPLLWTDGIEVNNASTFSGGTGVEVDPYLISTAADLAQMAVNVNNGNNQYSNIFFRQTANIDLSGKYWIPIADGKTNAAYSFKGHYDGDFHVVMNMKIKASLCNSDNKRFLGLFAWMYFASLKNLGVVGAELLVDNDRNDDAALLLGYADNTTVDRCFATGSVEATATKLRMGGLVGQNYLNGFVTNCFFIGSLESAKNNNTGGLMPFQRVNVENCYVAATIVSEATTKYAITDKNSNCFYDNTLNSIVTGGQGTGLSTEEMKSEAMATQLGEAFAYNSEYNNGYPYLVGFEAFYQQKPETSTGFKKRSSGSLVSAASGRIVCNESFEIYNLLGQNVTSQNGSLPSGIFMIATPSFTFKVVMK